MRNLLQDYNIIYFSYCQDTLQDQVTYDIILYMRKHKLINRYIRTMHYSLSAVCVDKWMVMYSGLDHYINENLYFIDNVYVTSFINNPGTFLLACDEVTPYIYK